MAAWKVLRNNIFSLYYRLCSLLVRVSSLSVSGGELNAILFPDCLRWSRQPGKRNATHWRQLVEGFVCGDKTKHNILPHHPHSPSPINRRADKRCSRVSFVAASEWEGDWREKVQTGGPKTERGIILLLENQIIFWVLSFLCVFHGLLSSASWQAMIPNVCRSARCRPFYQWARSNSP